MKRIQLLKPYRNLNEGEIAGFDNEEGTAIIQEGIGILVAVEDAEEATTEPITTDDSNKEDSVEDGEVKKPKSKR